MILNMPKSLRLATMIMRVICPLAALASGATAYADYELGLFLMMAIAVTCLIINLALTWVQWFNFKI